LAHFLFRIGFIQGQHVRSNHNFVEYDRRPHLLKDPRNPDEGLKWSVHPCYRSHLGIQ
jgi:hypothetical protein